MTALLDTNALYWCAVDPSQLSARAFEYCSLPTNALLVSTISLWELQIKIQIGKLSLDQPFAEFVNDCSRQGLTIIDMELDDVLRLSQLPLHHRDPFDRILICQALRLNCPLVTRDETIRKYPVQTLW